MNCLTACFNFVASNKAVQDALQNAIQEKLLPKLDALPMGVHLRGLINRGGMTGFTKILDLAGFSGLDPDDVQGADGSNVQDIFDGPNPFINMIKNIMSGGGRRQRHRLQEGGDAGVGVVDGKLCGQDFEALRQQCLESGELFTDPEFPPDAQSLFYTKEVEVEWVRASQLSPDPQLFVEGASRFDINQGALGDCWLLAAIANLTMNKEMLHKVVPLDQSFQDNYAGIFHFQFWQYGEWVDVVVDDYLPSRDGKLIFMNSDSGAEFWTALLEKAYAKLHGCYENLDGGMTKEAMVDFTGGCCEMYKLKGDECPPDLFNMMDKAYQRKSMAGCSITPDPDEVEARTDVGLVKGHAYSITKVLKAETDFQGQVPLVRVRNPWGNEVEWKGPWADGSDEWSGVPDDQKEDMGLTFEDDGEFWMSYDDFVKYFDDVEICNLSPDAENALQDGAKWEVGMFNGSWVPGDTAGGCRNYLETFAMNPQYRISVTDPDDDDEDNLCTVIVSVMQKGRRAMRDEGGGCLTIGFALYHVPEEAEGSDHLDTDFFKYNKSVGRSRAFINLRENSARFRLPPGNYCIVPSTFKPDEAGEFLLRVFSEKPCL